MWAASTVLLLPRALKTSVKMGVGGGRPVLELACVQVPTAAHHLGEPVWSYGSPVRRVLTL